MRLDLHVYEREVRAVAEALREWLGDSKKALAVALAVVLGHKFGEGDAYAGFVLRRAPQIVWAAVKIVKEAGVDVADIERFTRRIGYVTAGYAAMRLSMRLLQHEAIPEKVRARIREILLDRKF